MKANFKKMDKTLLFLMIAFTIFGAIMIFSASSITAVLYNRKEEYYFFTKHIIISLFSWIFGLLIVNIPLRNYRYIISLAMIFIILALGGLFIYAPLTNSVRSWYDLGFFSLQPSEFAKSITIVFLAIKLEQINKNKDFKFKKVIKPFFIVFIAFLLIFFQPDAGTAIVLAGITFFIFLAKPFKIKKNKNYKLYKLIIIIGAVALCFLGSLLLTKEQLSRLEYSKPCTRYLEKTGYQVCNGFIAISNGGLRGKGLGDSTQKFMYLPEAYTDFIFPIIVEEVGALWAIFIIFLYCLMLFRILKISLNASNLSGSIIAFGSFTFLLLHLLINFLGVLALMPLTGIPIPFLSYGGSFYINVIFVLFLTQRVQIESYNSKKKKILRA